MTRCFRSLRPLPRRRGNASAGRVKHGGSDVHRCRAEEDPGTAAGGGGCGGPSGAASGGGGLGEAGADQGRLQIEYSHGLETTGIHSSSLGAI